MSWSGDRNGTRNPAPIVSAAPPGAARNPESTARGWRQFSNTGKDWRQIRRSGRGNMIIRMPRLTSRQILIVVHDLVATAAAIVASFYIRFEEPGLVDRLQLLLAVLP